MNKYYFDYNKLNYLIEKQREEFISDINKRINNSGEIKINPRGYKVNTENKIFDNNINAISFFSGAGGLDIGTQLADVKVISSLDFDSDSVKTMESNKYFSHTKHICGDIQNISASDYKDVLKINNPEKLILVGGPPCQPFSKAGYWVKLENRLGSADPRNMIGQYLRMIDELKPDGFILENVESILHPKNKEAVEILEETIDKLGYKFIVYKANALDFGVPQRRKRIFFIASRKSIDDTVKITHGDEKMIVSNNELKPHERVVDWIAKFDSETYFEKEEVFDGKTYEFEVKAVPPGKNYISLTEKHGYPNPKFVANKRFWTFLLKLHPLESSWTIAAQPGPWVGPMHWNNRRLRVPEIAALQTFPEDYIFYGNRRSIQKQIGNAVPCLLGKGIVEHLKRFI